MLWEILGYMALLLGFAVFCSVAFTVGAGIAHTIMMWMRGRDV